MKICIVTSSYPLNPNDTIDAGVFVRDFAKQLNKTEYKVFVFTPRKEGIVENEREFEVYFFPWLGKERDIAHQVDPKNLKGFIKILSLLINGSFYFFRFVKKRRIDRCLAMWAIPSGLFTLLTKKFFKVPYDVWALGSDIWKRKEYPFGEILVKKILLNADNRFADGIDFARDIEKISGKKCNFIPSCRTLPINIKGKAAVDKKKTNFLFIGRWEKEKGIDILIDATKLLFKEIKEIKLYVFGGGSLEKLIHEKIDKYNLKDFIYINGFANPETAVKYLRACDCLVIPSRIESIPIVLSDALQMKKPVIVSDVGDMGKLVKKYKMGLVAEPENAEDLKDKMINFIKEDITKYQKNIDLLASKFNIQKIVQKYIDYLNS